LIFEEYVVVHKLQLHTCNRTTKIQIETKEFDQKQEKRTEKMLTFVFQEYV